MHFYTHAFYRRSPSAVLNRTRARTPPAHLLPRAGLQERGCSRVKNEHVTVRRIKTRRFRSLAALRFSPAHLLRRVDTEGYPLYWRAGLGRHTGGSGGFGPCILSISPAAAQRALCHRINQKSWPQVAHRSQSRRRRGRDGRKCAPHASPPQRTSITPSVRPARNFARAPLAATPEEELRFSAWIRRRSERTRQTDKHLFVDWQQGESLNYRLGEEKGGGRGQNERSVQNEDSPSSMWGA